MTRLYGDHFRSGIICGTAFAMLLDFRNGVSIVSQLYMYVWLVCCGSIRRLIIFFGSKGVSTHLLRFLFVLASSSAIPRLIISPGNFFRSKRVILLLTLKERAIHDRLLLQYPSIDNFFRSKGVFTHLLRFLFVSLIFSDPSIDNFFRSKRVILSLTLKERAIHVCLASLLWQYPSIDNFFRSKGVFTHLLRFLFVSLIFSDPSIDNFFRSKRVILLLTLRERAIHVCLASLLWQYPSIDNFFRSKGVFTHLLRFLFVLASSLACFFVYTLGEICGRSFFRTRNHTLHSPLCVFVLTA